MKNNGPELWNRLLELVRREIDPTAIIAGGAVRDYLLETEPKDIDVFVNVPVSRLKEWHSSQNSDFDHLEMGLMDRGDIGNYATDLEWNPDVMGVLDGHWVPDPKNHMERYAVQIIAHPVDLGITFSPVEDFAKVIMERMDIGLCQAVYDGNTMISTEAFIKDHEERRLTIIRQESRAGILASVNRVERIMNALNIKGVAGGGWRWGTEPEPVAAENKSDDALYSGLPRRPPSKHPENPRG